jgi:hypothetical protein
LQDRLGLLRRQLELLEIFGLVGLERLAVRSLQQGHAEVVDGIAFSRLIGVENECAGDIFVFLFHRRHGEVSSFRIGCAARTPPAFSNLCGPPPCR